VLELRLSFGLASSKATLPGTTFFFFASALSSFPFRSVVPRSVTYSVFQRSLYSAHAPHGFFPGASWSFTQDWRAKCILLAPVSSIGFLRPDTPTLTRRPGSVTCDLETLWRIRDLIHSQLYPRTDANLSDRTSPSLFRTSSSLITRIENENEAFQQPRVL